ncbi:host cell division inhibitor Icd-like protein [Hafnia alvei]|uniref:host cell division inhibitor Icd-like protein n=2 Tax=Hafniaceae TaxID=1903412 RepID=UPI0032C01C48
MSPVATVNTPLLMIRVGTPYIKKNGKKSIDVGSHQDVRWVHTLTISWCSNCDAPECGNTSEASIHNVTRTYIMACLHDTKTRPNFTYLFLGTPSDLPTCTPTVLRAEADSEAEARAKFIDWDLTFAAQIRTAAPSRLQLFSTDDGFMWIYEQRQEASHA